MLPQYSICAYEADMQHGGLSGCRYGCIAMHCIHVPICQVCLQNVRMASNFHCNWCVFVSLCSMLDQFAGNMHYPRQTLHTTWCKIIIAVKCATIHWCMYCMIWIRSDQVFCRLSHCTTTTTTSKSETLLYSLHKQIWHVGVTGELSANAIRPDTSSFSLNYKCTNSNLWTTLYLAGSFLRLSPIRMWSSEAVRFGSSTSQKRMLQHSHLPVPSKTWWILENSRS